MRVPGSDGPGGKARQRTHGVQEGHRNQRGLGAQGARDKVVLGKGFTAFLSPQ